MGRYDHRQTRDSATGRRALRVRPHTQQGRRMSIERTCEDADPYKISVSAGTDVPHRPIPGAASADRTGARCPQEARRTHRRQSRQQLHGVRPCTRYTGITANRGGLCRTKPAQPPSSPRGKSKRGRQSGRTANPKTGARPPPAAGGGPAV